MSSFFYACLIFFEIIKYMLCITDYTNFVKNVTIYISKINIFYVKICQWTAFSLCGKNGIIDEELYNFFYNFKDNVEYEAHEINYESIQNLIQNSRKDNMELVMESYSPVNAGTIALVFKGKLDGKPVAIKILRKNIVETLNKFLRHFDIFITYIKYIPFLKIQNNIEIFLESNKCSFSEQIDFLQEVNNIELFYKKFKNDKSIIIPKVYKKYTELDKNIIIMDFLEGMSINDINKEEYKYYSNIKKKFIMSCYTLKGIYHGDLHTGNIIYIKKNIDNKINYKLGIIDFGFIGITTINEENFIHDFILNIFNNNNQYKKYECIIDYILNEYENMLDNKIIIKNNILKDIKELNIKKDNVYGIDIIKQYELFSIMYIFNKYNINFPKKLCNILLSLICVADSLEQIYSYNSLYENRKMIIENINNLHQ